MKREWTIFCSFKLVEQSQDEQRLLEMDKDVDCFIEGPSEEFVLDCVAFVGVLDGGNAFSVVQGLIKWTLFYPLAVILTKIIDLLPESVKRVLFNNILSSLLFLLFLLTFLLFLCLLLSFLLFLQFVLLNLIHVFFQVSQSPACSFCILFIVIDVVVELDQLCVFSQGPFSQAICVEVVFVALEINEML